LNFISVILPDIHKLKRKGAFMTFRQKNIDQEGFAVHVLLPLLIIVAIAGIGLYMLNRSSANTIPPGKVYLLPAAAPKPLALAPQAPDPDPVLGNTAHAVVTSIPDAVWNTMNNISWRTGCPVGRSSLSLMKVNYWGFDGYPHRGQMVFRSTYATQFKAAFTAIYDKRIPLHGMYLVDKFGYSAKTQGGDDYKSMQYDNTSAFNCRLVDGTTTGTRSPHSYGTAVDINPYENPYHSADGWVPNVWWATHTVKPYTWRTTTDSFVVMMKDAGFKWTYTTNDSQHFDIIK
jgi:hypothetical protein